MKNKDLVIFYVDDLPTAINPSECYDSNSKLLCSMMYKTIYSAKNGKFITDIICDKSSNNLIKFEFCEKIFWSDGTQLTAKDFFDTLKYLLTNKKECSYYLSFIKGVKEFLYHGGSINDIKIWFVDNTFYAEVDSLKFYKDVFSGINFAPLKFLGNDLNCLITSGGYFCSFYSDNIFKLIKNDKSLALPDIIEVRVEKNVDKQIKQISLGEKSYTGFTSLNLDTIYSKKNYYELQSNIRFRLIFSEKLYEESYGLPIKNAILNKLRSNVNLVKFIKFNKRSYQAKINLKNIPKIGASRIKKILYPDYFPNNLLVDSICEVFSQNNVYLKKNPCSFKEFLEADYSKYDFILELIEPLTQNILDNFIEQIQFIRKEYRADFVKKINSYLNATSKSQLSIYNELLSMIEKESRVLDIGIFRQYYIKNSQLPKIVLTDNGLIELEEMFKE